MSKGVAIGLTNLHYADLLTDDAASKSFSYGDPVRIAGAISANFSPNASNDTLFADDGPYDSAFTLGAMSLELNVADIPPQIRAHLLGETYENGYVSSSSEAIPPYVAIGMSVKKSNGADRLIWYLKGKFAPPDENNQTKADSINWNTPSITGNFLKRDADNLWRVAVDTDDPNVTADVKSTWFTRNCKALGGAGTSVGSISLDKDTATLAVGASSGNTLTATQVPASAVDVVWTTSDPAVATVAGSGAKNATGTITAITAGTAIITARAGDKFATCVLTVTA